MDADCEDDFYCNDDGVCEERGEFLGDAPIPLRAAQQDISWIFDIIMAFHDNLDPMDPAVLAANWPDRSSDEFDLDLDGDFDALDVDRGIQRYIHDPYDADNDGLIGIIEIDCDLQGTGRMLDPMEPITWNGVPDGEVDCDGDSITNAEELSYGMNPLAALDSELDFDGDELSNLLEHRSLMDPRDPEDGRADADEDGLSNAQEISHGLNPNHAADAEQDADLDALTNIEEILNGLDPFNPDDAIEDPDGDGMHSRAEIRIGRDPLRANCADDPTEAETRNDNPEDATDLGDDAQILVNNGTICNNPGLNDQDWYRFTINEARSRLLVSLDFDNADGSNLDLRLYNGATGFQIADSSSNFATELIAVPSAQITAGDYLVRVISPRGSQADYALKISIIPPVTPCQDDGMEGDLGNNMMSNATLLEGDAVRLGEVWICEDERRSGDWFQLDLRDQDRTIHIQYARNSDGLLEISAMTQNLSAFAESVEVQTTSQCINLRANGDLSTVFFNIVASNIFSDGDDRVDYVLQVVNTDLDANPRGACDELNAGLFGFINWPTLRP